MTKLDETLAERGQTNGDFGSMCRVITEIKTIIGMNGFELAPHEREALHMIAHKIGRILVGDPKHRDHWHDIAGYATLVADRCPEGVERVIERSGE